jgi:hypothetical protein
MPGWHTQRCRAPNWKSSRFIEVVERFIDTTEPSEYDQAALRELLRTGGGAQTVSGPVDTRAAVLEAMGSDERSAT